MTGSKQLEAVAPPEVNNAMPTPAPEFDDGGTDDEDTDDEGGGDGDMDQPGWLVRYRDGKQPEVIHLEDTDDDALPPEEVLANWESAIKNGRPFFKLGTQYIRVEDVRAFGWSEHVDLPESDRFDSLQDRIEALMDAVEDVTRSQQAMTERQAALQDSYVEAYQAEIGLMRREAAQVDEETPLRPTLQVSPPTSTGAPVIPPQPGGGKGALKLPGM